MFNRLRCSRRLMATGPTTALRKTVRQRRRGAACIEMAVIAPYLFLLVFGSIEFARMVMVKQSLTNAAREGCRTAVLALTDNDNDVESAVRQYLRGSIADYSDSETVRVSIDPTNVANQPTGTTITVSVEVDCGDVSWLPAGFLGGVTLQANATMNRE